MTAQIEKKAIGNLLLENIPDIPKDLETSMQPYQNIREGIFLDWLPGKKGLLMATRFQETQQIHQVTQPGGARRQLTFYKEPVQGAAVRPGSENYCFWMDEGGDEDYQIYYFPSDEQQARCLTDGYSKHTPGVWNRQGTRIATTTTRRNGRDYEVVLLNPDHPGQYETVLSKEGYWSPLDWSPDGSKLLLLHYRSIVDSEVHLLDLPTRALTPLRPFDADTCYTGEARWSRDGKSIYLISDAQGEFRNLMRYTPGDDRWENLTYDLPWDVELLEISPDGEELAFSLNENGYSRLYQLYTATGRYRLWTRMPNGQISGMRWHPTENTLAFTLATPQAPGDVFSLLSARPVLQRWTYSETGGLPESQFVTPELVHFPAFDRGQPGAPDSIAAFLYLPKVEMGPHPVLIYIHGGPESQFRPAFNPIFQHYLKELGVAVIAPNVRGSSGYGKSYLSLDNGYKREHSVMDIGSLLNWIGEQPQLDPNRVAVMGGSYGGYMVLAAMVHFNDRLRCGVDFVGISNFVTFLRNTQDYRRDLRRVEYGDERDPDMRRHLEAISPSNNAHKISKPLFIIQGLNDPRVPVSEAEQMVKAVRNNGAHPWYMLAKDEGHGFRKKTNRDFFNLASILFLQTNLVE